MGSTASTPLSAEEKVRKQQLEKMGVLIPPSFGVSTETLPPSSARMPSPSYLESLEKDLLYYRILHDHMTSGLWVSATTPSHASVLASFVISDGSSGGTLSASQKWNHGQADIQAYTFAPAIASAHYAPVPGWNLYGNVGASGLGWLGCHALPLEWLRKPSQTYYRNNPFAEEEQKAAASRIIQKIQIGSSLQVQSPCKVTDLSDIAVQDFRGYASMDVSGCTVAMEASVPLKTLDPQVGYHISCDLNTDEGPPLIVSMQSGPARSSMNLSQVLTFDRYVLNVFETRCPRVRNTLGWAVQMEKEKDSDAQLTAGLAWQLNRAVCVKMVVNPADGVTGAVLLKRWRQPRVLCSLLAGIASGKKPSFGFGLELETGPQHGQDYYRDKEDRRGHVEEEAPATKATLPNVD